MSDVRVCYVYDTKVPVSVAIVFMLDPTTQCYTLDRTHSNTVKPYFNFKLDSRMSVCGL